MGLNIKPVRRLHKLRSDVSDNVPGHEKVEKLDKTLNSSPGSYKVARGIRRRHEESFGGDALERDKPKLAWEVDATLDRFDFDAGAPTDFGIRITLPSSAQLSDRGLKAGDELRILDKGSTLKGKRFKVVSEANTTNVALGKARLVSATVLRLKDVNPFTTENTIRIRIELEAGNRR